MKNLTLFTKAILFIIFSVNNLSSQSSLTESIVTASVSDAEYLRESSKKSVNELKSEPKPISAVTSEIFYDISDVDLSTTIDVVSNEMNFSGGDNKKYTKMQLTHKHSNKTVLSRKIESNYTIDLNKIVPGTYILMLSNENGNLRTEEISIF